jgi:hypothetical protein
MTITAAAAGGEGRLIEESRVFYNKIDPYDPGSQKESMNKTGKG